MQTENQCHINLKNVLSQEQGEERPEDRGHDLAQRAEHDEHQENECSVGLQAIIGCRLTVRQDPVHDPAPVQGRDRDQVDRKSTRLNSSHQLISYAVFCLKKKKVEGEERYDNSKRESVLKTVWV